MLSICSPLLLLITIFALHCIAIFRIEVISALEATASSNSKTIFLPYVNVTDFFSVTQYVIDDPLSMFGFGPGTWDITIQGACTCISQTLCDECNKFPVVIAKSAVQISDSRNGSVGGGSTSGGASNAGGLSAGVIIGIIVAAIVVLIVVGVLVSLSFARAKQAGREKDDKQSSSYFDRLDGSHKKKALQARVETSKTTHYLTGARISRDPHSRQGSLVDDKRHQDNISAPQNAVRRHETYHSKLPTTYDSDGDEENRRKLLDNSWQNVTNDSTEHSRSSVESRRTIDRSQSLNQLASQTIRDENANGNSLRTGFLYKPQWHQTMQRGFKYPRSSSIQGIEKHATTSRASSNMTRVTEEDQQLQQYQHSQHRFGTPLDVARAATLSSSLGRRDGQEIIEMYDSDVRRNSTASTISPIRSPRGGRGMDVADIRELARNSVAKRLSFMSTSSDRSLSTTIPRSSIISISSSIDTPQQQQEPSPDSSMTAEGGKVVLWVYRSTIPGLEDALMTILETVNSSNLLAQVKHKILGTRLTNLAECKLEGAGGGADAVVYLAKTASRIDEDDKDVVKELSGRIPINRCSI
jgi:hypothetical protein